MLKVVIILALLLVAALLSVVIFVNQKSFGRNPRGARLERMMKSPHYRDGEWRNEVPTVQMTSDKGFVATMWDFLFKEHPGTKPDHPVEVTKTNLLSLPDSTDCIVWFGHSSYLLRLSGRSVLVDPVFYQASPVGFFNKPFDGTNVFTTDDIPDVDYLIITHDHWDHLDYQAVTELLPRVGKAVLPLGVGEHLEYWGYPADKIVELDWNERWDDGGFTFHCLPARHFSGRGLKRNATAWASFMVESPSLTVYCGGDGGYGPHFAKIGASFPTVDYAIIENGQYNTQWANIHTMPEHLSDVMTDLKAKHYITVHHLKYALAFHSWDEPLRNEAAAAEKSGMPLTVLTIGKPECLEK